MPISLRRLPDGVPFVLPDEAGIGAAPYLTLVLHDDYISTNHAEITPREEGLTLLATRGECRVDGRSVKRAIIAAGQRWWFAPGVEFEVLEVQGHGEAVSATRAPFVWRVGPEDVEVCCGASSCRVQGQQAGLLRLLLEEPGVGRSWEELGRAILEQVHYKKVPIEERFRIPFSQAFDFHQKSLCAQLEALRAEADPLRAKPMIWKQRGDVYLRWDPLRDRVEYEQTARLHPA